MVAAGQNPTEVEAGDPHPTRQDCRTCHQIHTTFTSADFALATTDPVALFATEGVTFDGGEGNLCANCHQARRAFPAAENGMITGITTHWGPHHGPQSSMLMGVAGAGAEGSPSPHAQMVENTCVTCHMGESGSHTFAPDLATCQGCHSGAESFDINGVQTEVQTQLDELGTQLVAAGVLSDITVDGHPTVTEAPEGVATALYNWIYIAHEDKSLGVHNPAYTQALLDAAFAALGQ
jgi:cytochrome c551/c552